MTIADNYRAGWTRVVMGVFALTVVPVVLPRLEGHRWFFATYTATALLVQVLIKKDIGGQWRALGMGIVDLGVITFLVHRTGSVGSMLVSLYFLIGTLNALVASRSVAYALAIGGVMAYVAVLVAESRGWLPYAPDGADLGIVRPSSRGVVAAALMVAILLLTSTALVSGLAEALRQREKQLVAANARLEELSLRDPLTQLYNRRHLVARIGEELERVRRGHALSLLMLDLDGFKRVNDAHGHQAGDRVLVEIAGALAATTRAADVCGRYGGDEFLVIIPGGDVDQARALADRLVVAVRDAAERSEAESRVTASIGIAAARAEDGVRDLVRRADEAAYRAKMEGGDRVIAGLAA